MSDMHAERSRLRNSFRATASPPSVKTYFEPAQIFSRQGAAMKSTRAPMPSHHRELDKQLMAPAGRFAQNARLQTEKGSHRADSGSRRNSRLCKP